ncbi:OmpH family outer membrane protein [Desulfovibrio sp. OttesenSCG-928-C06]|nr:OmpH family outer membrane protein [Desulfovibrio sp. OttesenSCG-928-C06]
MTLKKLALPYLALALALTATLGLSACNSDAPADKIAMVDAEAVFQKSKLAAAGMKHIESMNAQLQERLGKMQEELLADSNNAELEQRLQSELFALQASMDESQRAVAEQINGIFDKAVEDCRKTSKLEVILPKQLVMAAREGADVTDKVVELMDKQTVDFSAITLKGIEAAKDTAPADKPADAAQSEAPKADALQDEAPKAEAPATDAPKTDEGAAPADKPADAPAEK